MSNKSPFINPKLKAQKSSRNSFDLGHKFAFHTSLGELIPCCYLDVPAGSYVELGEENQTYNFNPLVRPAFTRLKEHIDYFAVPKVQLWSLYDNFITGQAQYMSSSLGAAFLAGINNGQETPVQVPMFNGAFLKEVFKQKYNETNAFGLRELDDTMKLLNYLGYGNFYNYFHNVGSVDDIESQASNISVSLLPQNFFNLLAYQKIYFSYYRNSKYEQNIPTAYNLDWLPKSKLNLSANDFVANDFSDIFTLRHRWLKKDYFMSCQPSVLPTSNDIGFEGLSRYLQEGMSASYGDQNTTWQIFSLPGLVSKNVYNTSHVATNSNNTGQDITMGIGANGSTGAGVNVSAIRFAFAFDKLLRRMRSAGATFDDQMLAQFGIKPVDYRHGDAYYLGGYTNRLNVSEVTQTSQESGVDIRTLGQFGANISKYSSNKRKISYKAKEDCIIMGIYSTSYDVDYASSRYDRCNLKKYRFDFYNPAFENLGLQAVYTGEMSMIDDQLQYSQIPYTPIASRSATTQLLGYNKRYLEYKTKIDTVAGLLDFASHNDSAAAWTTQYRPFIYLPDGTLITHLQEPLTMAMMLVNPIVMDDICTVDYSSAWTSDHFMVNLYNDVKLVANMSIDGETF